MIFIRRKVNRFKYYDKIVSLIYDSCGCHLDFADHLNSSQINMIVKNLNDDDVLKLKSLLYQLKDEVVSYLKSIDKYHSEICSFCSKFFDCEVGINPNNKSFILSVSLKNKFHGNAKLESFGNRLYNSMFHNYMLYGKCIKILNEISFNSNASSIINAVVKICDLVEFFNDEVLDLSCLISQLYRMEVIYD